MIKIIPPGLVAHNSPPSQIVLPTHIATHAIYKSNLSEYRIMFYLEAGDTIDEFLDGFPSVSRDQVVALLEAARARILPDS